MESCEQRRVSDSENGNAGDILHHDRLIDLKTVADLLGVCTRSVHRLVAAGVLAPPAKVGRASRWFMTDIDRYMETLKATRVKLTPVWGAS
jgi:predicted DNA-binding transcriptional regulator AlpA